MNREVREELLAARRRDEETRARLAREGTLFQGYAQAMERVHGANAALLEAIVERHGWPGRSLVGSDGAEAAWIIAQHAIGKPAFQRRCLELLRAAVRGGEAPPSHEAYLTDRIRFNERRPQRFGTIFDWDERGEMSPWRIEDPEGVDARRAAVGLPPLARAVARIRDEARKEGNLPPADFRARQLEIEEWARRVGWL